jgi:hypothetical protein
MYESTVCACLFIICPLLNKKTYREREPAEGWVLPSVVLILLSLGYNLLCTMLCVQYLSLTLLVLGVSGQGDHRRRPADRDEDDASFKVQYNTTYYALYSENDVRYYVSLNAWRKNRVLDRLNLSASVPANMVNPLFVQPADDVADLGSGVVVLPGGSTPPVPVNGTAKGEAVTPWFGWLGTVPVVGMLPYMFLFSLSSFVSSGLTCGYFYPYIFLQNCRVSSPAPPSRYAWCWDCCTSCTGAAKRRARL